MKVIAVDLDGGEIVVGQRSMDSHRWAEDGGHVLERLPQGDSILIHISCLRRVIRIRHTLDLAQRRVALFGIDKDRRGYDKDRVAIGRKADLRLAGIRFRTGLIRERLKNNRNSQRSLASAHSGPEP